MRTNSWPLGICSLLLYAFLYAPICVVIVYSFNAARFGSRWTGFTTSWYASLRHNDVALEAARNTLLLGVSSTLLSLIIGTLLGYSLGKYKFSGKRLLSRFLYVPVFVPDIVMGVALLLFYSLVRSWTGLLELGMTTMIFAHVTFQIPFVAIVVRARVAGLDPALQEAARDLGATRWQGFYHVTLPLLAPGIIAAGMLAFTLSIDDFVVSFFTSGPGSATLPILIYSSVKRGITPDINALSTLIIMASFLGVLVITLLQREQKR